MYSDEEIYESIARDAQEELGIGEDDPIIDEIFKAKEDSNNAVHCFFSPSKSNGWAICPAYLARATQWKGSNEPAIRGTITHHFMSRAINLIKESTDFDFLDRIRWAVFGGNRKWLSRDGVNSAAALITVCGGFFDWQNVQSEVFLLSDTLGIPNKNLRFGGSIDILYINEKVKNVWVMDLKTGKHPVSPNSWQLKCYAMLVREKLLNHIKGLEDWEYVLGIGQGGMVSRVTISNNELDYAEKRIREVSELYEKYREHEGADEEIPECFHENPYCRFCKGCFRGEM